MMYQLDEDDKIKILTSIEIKGRVSDIWEVLTDVGHWDKWSEHIAVVAGKFEKDESIKVRFNTPEGKVHFDRKLVIFEPQRVFCWEGESMFPGLKDHHIFYLEEKDGGKVRFVQADGFHGTERSHEAILVEEQLKGLYDVINAELKDYMEKRSTAI